MLKKAIANDLVQNLQKINHHGKRADGIVKAMLQHSRTSSGQKEATDINVLCDEYLRLSYHGLRAKNKSRIWLEFSLDSPAEMIGWFGAGELLRPPAESFQSWLSRVERVSAADVRRVANAVFRRENLVACAVGPLSEVERKLRAAVESAL